MSRHEQKIEDAAARVLEDDEQPLAVCDRVPPAAAPSRRCGSLQLGSAQRGRAHAAADPVDLRLEAPMGVAITQRRLITLKLGTPIGLGIRGKLKQLMSAVPLEDVDSIVVKRMALGYMITLTIRGVEIRLEANAASGARTFAAAFERARTAGA
jgi:hypothetical protein